MEGTDYKINSTVDENLNILYNVHRKQHNFISSEHDDINVGTPIQKFYSGQIIFITGGTGFLGKALIEKLLRSCPDISKIYISIRPKKNMGIQERLDKMFSNPLFDVLKEKNPNFRDKIVPLECDMFAENLGISDDDMNKLINEISIMFHGAATVRFNDKIQIATALNVTATSKIIEIAKRMQNLKSFIHMSTIYSNCFVEHIEERIYTYTICPKDLIKLAPTLSNSELEKKLASTLAEWPNTYIFTKALAESLIKTECMDLPVGIFRPCIVTSTAYEPVPGWVDNLNGPMGLTAIGLKGMLSILYCRATCGMNIMPVDFTINALIASAWDVFNQPHRRGDKMLIYNQTPVHKSYLTWSKFTNYIKSIENSSRKIDNSAYGLNGPMPSVIFVSNRFVYTISSWFCHILPALLFDMKELWFGTRRRFAIEVSLFVTKEWIFDTYNIEALWRRLSKQDQCLFNFDMKGFNWLEYTKNYTRGIHRYLLHNDVVISKDKHEKSNRSPWLYNILKIVSLCAFIWLAWQYLLRMLLHIKN